MPGSGLQKGRAQIRNVPGSGVALANRNSTQPHNKRAGCGALIDTAYENDLITTLKDVTIRVHTTL